jgi:hypothetical protein
MSEGTTNPNPENIILEGEGEPETPAWMNGLTEPDGGGKLTDNPLAGVKYDTPAVKKAAEQGEFGDILPEGRYTATVTSFEPRHFTNSRNVAMINFTVDTHEGEYSDIYYIFPTFIDPQPISEKSLSRFYGNMHKINPSLGDKTPDEVVKMLGLTPDCMKGCKFGVVARKEIYKGIERNKFMVNEYRPAPPDMAKTREPDLDDKNPFKEE